jgi:hypothetical protein
VSSATPRVFAIFLVGGTLVSWLVLWLTGRLFFFVHDTSYDEVIPPAWFAYLALSLVWILPGQIFVAAVAGLFFSFFKRVPFWFVCSVLIPICGLIVTYRDITDRIYTIATSDLCKLLYWMFVVTPGALLCTKFVALKVQTLNRGAAVADGS